MESLNKESLEFSPPNYVRFKNEETRKVAYSICAMLVKSDPAQIQGLTEKYLLPVVRDGASKIALFNYKPFNCRRSTYNYVGLKNLGSICYMNAILQQFFMTKTFRYAMIACQDEVPENFTDYNGSRKEYKNRRIDDNVLHQFQKMFTFLELSERIDYNPVEFCYSFKDFQNQPVNVSIQQDAQEFLNMIFDKLENGVKKTHFKYLLDSVFGGGTCS